MPSNIPGNRPADSSQAPLCELVIDQPAVEDPSSLSLALGVQAMVARSCWFLGLEAVPACETLPNSQQLHVRAVSRPPHALMADMAQRGIASRFMLQLTVNLCIDGLQLGACLVPAHPSGEAALAELSQIEEDGERLSAHVSPSLIVEAGALDPVDALTCLLEFVLDHLAPQLNDEAYAMATDPRALWAIEDPALLIAHLSGFGATLMHGPASTESQRSDELDELDELTQLASSRRSAARTLN